ncbi:NBS-LRR-like resistance protein [Rhynchospora pubera]|uniref:NBS-LRR-like resistance protein n=1 Tax=Rhynchospora pubera TaxID=906938 RepID=A0AAV8GDC8_9POAL|nr:NBS-LRR-like resistance protein [Rhynchospora pubera]
MEDIANEICTRLKGSPLAAKTLGRVLSQKIDKKYWESIRDSKIWKIDQGKDGITHVLYLSYMHLPSELKRCFSYCSMFSKDHIFHPTELVRFWIMNRFIPIQENLKSMENQALQYFHELENRGFFHCIWAYTERYVMHDLMHDVCQSLKGDECYCLEDEAFPNIPPNMHHMSVCHTKLLNEENLTKLHKPEKLQSLLVVSDNYGIEDTSRGLPFAFESLCNKLTNVRCLSLPRCYIKEIPENIENLKYLQYLDISNNPELKKLPESFCNLYGLEFLDMNGCSVFEADGFPSCCDKLRALKYFIPPDHVATSLKQIPVLSKTMQLYNLIYKVENDGENKIENLKLLEGIRGFLVIKGLENVSSKTAAEEAGLNKQELLDVLSLYWDDSSLENNEIHMEVLDGLCPHSNLEELKIYYYNGSHFKPRRMRNNDLPKLKRVMFDSCWNKTVSQLPCSITEIKIDWCRELESLVDCLQPNLLPKLKFIEIDRCTKLKSLPVESFFKFLSLEKLQIRKCRRLTCPIMMSLPPSIKYLYLDDCGELDKSIPSCLRNLTSLEDLRIWNCPNVVSIPNEVMANLQSLRRLDVDNCENLESLGDEEFLQSIDFYIYDCPKRQITWGGNPNGKQLSAAQGEIDSTAPSAPATIPAHHHIETQTTDDPSSSSPRNRKADAQN